MDLLALTQRLWSESGRLGPGPSAIVGLQGDQLRAANKIRDAWRNLQLERDKLWSWMRRSTRIPLSVGVGSYTAAGASLTDHWKWWPETMRYQPNVMDAPTAGNRLSAMTWLPYDEFREIHLSTPVSPGLPVDWSVAPNNTLLVGPAPQTAGMHLEIDYLTKPTELVLGSDTPNMPEEYHMLLVWMGLEQQAATDENQPEIIRAQRNARLIKSALMTDQALNPSMEYWEPLA